jgi:hypothetical protein
MKRISQKQKILEHFQTGESLTCEQCRDNKWGANLRSRVSDLKNDGFKIVSDQINFEGGYVAKYSLPKAYFIEQLQELSGLLVLEIAFIFKDIDNQYKFNNDCSNKELAKIIDDIKNNSYIAIAF